VAFAPDGLTLAIGGTDGSLPLSGLDSRHKRMLTPPALGPVSSVAYVAGGRYVASACQKDGYLRVWDATTGALRDSQGVLVGRILAVGPGGNPLVWAEGLALRVRRIEAGRLADFVHTFGHLGNVERLAAAFSPDGRTLAVADDQGITFLDWVNAQHRGTLSGKGPGYDSIAYVSDGKTLAAARSNGTVVLWSVSTRQEIFHLPAESSSQSALVRLAPDGVTLAVVCGWEDGRSEVRLYYRDPSQELPIEQRPAPKLRR
jgi:WD40 repeat protein